MKKVTKITLWILGALLLLCTTAFVCADIIVSHLVQKQVSQSFENIPDAEASVGKIYLNLISGTAVVKDISFRSQNISLTVPTLAVWNIRYLELLRHHRLVIHRIDISDVQTELFFDEKHPEALFPSLPKDTTLQKAPLWLQSAEVHHLDVSNLSTRLHSTRSALDVAVDSLSFSTPDLSYSFSDSVFSYNDSVYQLSLHALHVVLPDKSLAIEMHDFSTRNQGALSLGYTRVRHLASLRQMVRKAKEPTVWIDLQLNSLSTSAVNPLRKALAKDYTLDRLRVDVRRMHVCKDQSYKPKKPFDTPQDVLLGLPVRFRVNQVEALARKIDVELSTTEVNCGQLHLSNIQATLSNVTNRPGATWMSQAKAPFGKQGEVIASLAMHMDKKATFEVALDARDVQTEDLNGFIRPLIGITSECHIDHLNAEYRGDKKSANGEFCMQYTGLEVMVHKEDNIPYEVVSKNASTFTQLANTLIPKSNPTAVDPAPRRYMVEWQRDEWKPYPLYLFGPCIDGVKKTMLPGLYVHKQVKNGKR